LRKLDRKTVNGRKLPWIVTHYGLWPGWLIGWCNEAFLPVILPCRVELVFILLQVEASNMCMTDHTAMIYNDVLGRVTVEACAVRKLIQTAHLSDIFQELEVIKRTMNGI
jgi:hypothetical protein